MVLRSTGSFVYSTIILTVFLQGCLSQLQLPHPIRDALYLGNQSLAEDGNSPDCVWRRGADRDACPDPDMSYTLYSPEEPTRKQKVDLESSDWLRGTSWDSSLETILLIHGYAGGDDTLPIIVLRDAYLRAGKFNVIMVDWGLLCRPPCYVAAVHNLRSVARCTGAMVGRLLGQGLPVATLTCVGHSLGAHVCGIMANYLPFRIARIIGLDPARPLIRNSPALRLDPGDALHVQVLHTNAGHYGEGGRLGHMDVCINGGRSQPYCSNTPNEPLCSHIWSICYQAESLFNPQMAEPCGRRCPMGVLPQAPFPGPPLPIGQAAPLMAFGTFCVRKATAPFCPSDENKGVGDERCCLTASVNAGSIKNTTHYPNPLPRPPPPNRIPLPPRPNSISRIGRMRQSRRRARYEKNRESYQDQFDDDEESLSDSP